MVFKDFAETPKGRRGKPTPDVTRLNKLINMLDEEAVRISYTAFLHVLRGLGLVTENQARVVVAGFRFLRFLDRPWTVCKTDGTYVATALEQWKQDMPEGLMSRPVIQEEKADEVLAAFDTLETRQQNRRR